MTRAAVLLPWLQAAFKEDSSMRPRNSGRVRSAGNIGQAVYSSASAQRLASAFQGGNNGGKRTSMSENKPGDQRNANTSNAIKTPDQAKVPSPSTAGISEVTSILQMQAKVLQTQPVATSSLGHVQNAAAFSFGQGVAPSVPQGGNADSTIPSQAVIAETLQRANASAQALKKALTALSP